MAHRLLPNQASILQRVLEDLYATPSEFKRHLELLRTLDGQSERAVAVLTQLEEALVATKRTRIVAAVSATGAAASAASAAGAPAEKALPSAPTVAVFFGSRGLDGGAVSAAKRARVSSSDGADADGEAAHRQIRALQQQCRDKSEEKIAIVAQVQRVLEDHIDRIEADMAYFEQQLRAEGEFVCDGRRQPRDGALVAALVDAAAAAPPAATAAAATAATAPPPTSQWCMCRVRRYERGTQLYEVEDFDDSSSVYFLPSVRIVALPLEGTTIRKYAKAERVMAMYPSTTSFYVAEVRTLPKRTQHSNVFQLLFDGDGIMVKPVLGSLLFPLEEAALAESSVPVCGGTAPQLSNGAYPSYSS